jgi:demethylmenaquinone methyltransferase/2-methoxy-6-polyprenyl-1,4-benzoquinol methylase
MIQNPEKNSFGTRHVSADEKTALVRGVFDSVAQKYDIMNDVMSLGVHRLWKNRLIRQIRPRPEYRYLDVAGGTGDIAFLIRERIGASSDITIFDLNAEMLNVGRDRAINRGFVRGLEWINGNAESLPFADNSFDVYSIAFGLRNVTHIDTALAEAYRVLKKGGRFFCLEFSHLETKSLQSMYDLYSKLFIPRMGAMIAGDRESYQYLIESIRAFPTQDQLIERMQKAGFIQTRFVNLSYGIVAIHEGVKV